MENGNFRLFAAILNGNGKQKAWWFSLIRLPLLIMQRELSFARLLAKKQMEVLHLQLD
jgi:hypothetical protein